MESGDVHIPSKGIDKISSLHQDLINSIFVHLPIIDAVRTSILSSKWRYAWSNLHLLNFDENCRLSLKEKPTSSRLMRIVDHVLFLHNVPLLPAFVVSNYLLGYDLEMDKWVHALSRKEVRYLGLTFYKSVEDANQVSPSLFSCKQLRLLKLHHCTVEMPPSFQGFKYLTYLDLKTVTLHEATINNLLPLCPVLEKLYLEYDNHLGCLNINAAKLESLVIRGAFDNLVFVDCLELENINISMLNATYDIEENDIEENEIVDTSKLYEDLGRLPSLVDLGIRRYFLQVVHFHLCLNYFCIIGFPTNRKLFQYLALGTLEDRVPNAFANLKNLSLTVNFRDTKEISAALSIIRSSPNLESIAITEVL